MEPVGVGWLLGKGCLQILFPGKFSLTSLAHGCEEDAALMLNLILRLLRNSLTGGSPRLPFETGEKVRDALIVDCLGYKNQRMAFSIIAICASDGTMIGAR